MAWFWLALGAQFLFAVGAHVDKHLLSRYLRGAAPGSLILFSTIFGFVITPIAWAIDRRALDMPLRDAALALAGVLLFALAPTYRRQFLHTLRVNRAPVILLNTGNEVIAVVGYLLISYATLLAPIALVSVVGGFQPLLVFALGWLLARMA